MTGWQVVLAILALGISFFIGIYFYLQLVISSVDNSKTIIFMAVSSAAHVLSAFVSVFNLVWLIRFYFKEKKSREDDKAQAHKAQWFQALVLGKGLAAVETFFDVNNQIVQNAFDEIGACLKDNVQINECEQRIRTFFGQYTDAKRLVSSNFVDIVSVMDVELGRRIDSMFEEFQDEFSETLSSIVFRNRECDRINLLVKIADQKKKTMAVLYQIHQSK